MEAGPGNGARIGREYRVGASRIAVFDGLLQDAAHYQDALALAAFKRTEVARPDTVGYKHWASEIGLEALRRQPIMQLTSQALAAFDPSRAGHVPHRAYTNVAGYGDVLFTHADCLPGQRDITALWFICSEWDIEWGGETVFFDGDGEIACAVRPRPGRLVLFDGDILHAGRPPSRICFHPRYTLAIKLVQPGMQST